MASVGNNNFTQQVLSLGASSAAVFEFGIGIGSGNKRGLLGIDLNVAPPEEEEDGGEKRKPLFETTHFGDGEKLVDDEIGENEKRIRRWNAILGVAKDASAEYEKTQNQRRKITPLSELQQKKRNLSPYTHCFSEEESNSGNSYQNTVRPAPSLVVRSTRGRTVAMPNKYRDSVVNVPAEGLLFKRNRNEKPAAAAVLSSKRRSR